MEGGGLFRRRPRSDSGVPVHCGAKCVHVNGNHNIAKQLKLLPYLGIFEAI